MRIVFLGYQTWGHRVLAALLASRHDVPLVITHPSSDHPYKTIWNDSVAELAAAHGIEVLERRTVNDDPTVRLLRALAPDLLVPSDWRTWVAPAAYRCARFGAFNTHDALLPRYGGFAPLNWALVNGETEVGVTVHFMDEEFDLGDIVVQRAVPVDPGDTVTDLFGKTLPLFAPLTLEAIDLIEAGGQTWTPQDRATATFFHKRSTEDSRIDAAPAHPGGVGVGTKVRGHAGTGVLPRRQVRHRRVWTGCPVGPGARTRGGAGPHRRQPRPTRRRVLHRHGLLPRLLLLLLRSFLSPAPLGVAHYSVVRYTGTR